MSGAWTRRTRLGRLLAGLALLAGMALAPAAIGPFVPWSLVFVLRFPSWALGLLVVALSMVSTQGRHGRLLQRARTVAAGLFVALVLLGDLSWGAMIAEYTVQTEVLQGPGWLGVLPAMAAGLGLLLEGALGRPLRRARAGMVAGSGVVLGLGFALFNGGWPESVGDLGGSLLAASLLGAAAASVVASLWPEAGRDETEDRLVLAESSESRVIRADAIAPRALAGRVAMAMVGVGLLTAVALDSVLDPGNWFSDLKPLLLAAGSMLLLEALAWLLPRAVARTRVHLSPAHAVVERRVGPRVVRRLVPAVDLVLRVHARESGATLEVGGGTWVDVDVTAAELEAEVAPVRAAVIAEREEDAVAAHEALGPHGGTRHARPTHLGGVLEWHTLWAARLGFVAPACLAWLVVIFTVLDAPTDPGVVLVAGVSFVAAAVRLAKLRGTADTRMVDAPLPAASRGLGEASAATESSATSLSSSDADSETPAAAASTRAQAATTHQSA